MHSPVSTELGRLTQQSNGNNLRPEVHDAGETDVGTRPRGCAGRKVAFNTGGRICSGGDAPHSRREARSGLYQAGYCHWPLEGEACWSQAWVSGRKERVSSDKGESRAGLPAGTEWFSKEGFSEALACDQSSPEKRRTLSGFEVCAF